MRDVIIIGAGISGASVARELARYELDVLILDRENDVSNGTTKANSAIVHAGYNAKEGTLMAKYNKLGNAMFDDLARELEIPFKRCGSLVLAFSQEEREHLNSLVENARRNEIPKVRIVEKEELRKIEPNINKKAVAGLLAETAGIVGPWELTIGMLENAVDNGAKLRLNEEVIDIEKITDGYRVVTTENSYETKIVVNASGVYADKLHNLVAKPTYKISPRRGQYFVMDKSQGEEVGRVIFQCPTKLGKGVLITPTVHGNLLLGPDAEDISDKEDISTTAEKLQFVRDNVSKLIEKLNFRESIRNFAGLRAQSDRNDFVVEEAIDAPNFIDVGGIKSPGLTSAPAIGVDVAKIIAKKLDAKENTNFNPNRKQIIFMELSNEEKSEIIKKDLNYGRIICRCENITEGEIVDSIKRTVGATTVDGVKKRCRPGMGRCQGGFCGPRVQEIIARELNISLEEVVLDKKDSYILTGVTK